MNIKITIGLLSVTLSAGVVSGATLDLGTIELQPNEAGQRVALPDVVGLGEQVAGVNFSIQVADGGPEAGGSIVGPKITAVDIVGAGTIFHGNNNGQSGGGSLKPQIFEAVTTTSGGTTVEAHGTLAFVTFDTTGFNSGMFDLLMSMTRNGPTELLDTRPANVLTVQDGMLLIVPEPSSVALGLLALIGFLRFARRR